MPPKQPAKQPPPQQHADKIFGVPMILALPGATLGVVILVIGLGFATGAFDTPPQALPAAAGLEGSSPFKVGDGDPNTPE